MAKGCQWSFLRKAIAELQQLERGNLVSSCLKNFCKQYPNRIQGPLERILKKNQAGFHKGRATTDQILVLRHLVEEAQEWQKSLLLDFIVFKKAFDSVFREALRKILKSYSIPEKIVCLIWNSMKQQDLILMMWWHTPSTASRVFTDLLSNSTRCLP